MPEVEDLMTQSNAQVNDFIDAVEKENFTQASNYMNDILGVKMQDAMDQMKIDTAASIGQEEVDDEGDYDLDEDEIDVEEDLDDDEDS